MATPIGSVSTVVVCAVQQSDWPQVMHLCKDIGLNIARPQLGVHPWWVRTCCTDDARMRMLSALRDALAAHPDMGVGEIGIDKAPRALELNAWADQIALFQPQLELARDFGRTASVHCVRAFDDMVAAIERVQASRFEERQPYPTTFHAGSSTTEGADPCMGTHAGAGESRPVVPAWSVLFHSWAGAPTVTQRLMHLLPAGRAVFSYQGGIIPTVVAAVAQQLYSLASTQADARGETLTTPDVRGGGAGRSTMSTLSQLPPECLAFESDAPDQAFNAHQESAAYVAWSDAVFTAARAAMTDASRIQAAATLAVHTPGAVVHVALASTAWRMMNPNKGWHADGSSVRVESKKKPSKRLGHDSGGTEVSVDASCQPPALEVIELTWLAESPLTGDTAVNSAATDEHAYGRAEKKRICVSIPTDHALHPTRVAHAFHKLVASSHANVLRLFGPHASSVHLK
ncbi:MAG: hypothetical protein EOO65_04395 [Methanosarcinales archaeon]|nr:MAG: hypothetical protein EOO65_04395 [Methanosarcinales archaeon]